MREERLANILVAPHISEKSTRLGESSNQVVFRVMMDAKKSEIKTAVEKMFNVEVDRVTVINVRGKMKTFQRSVGHRPNWKKAYVRLKPGHDIDFLGNE